MTMRDSTKEHVQIHKHCGSILHSSNADSELEADANNDGDVHWHLQNCMTAEAPPGDARID